MWHGNDAHYKSFSPFAFIGIGFNQNFVEYPKQVLTHCPKKQETLESQTKLGMLFVPPHFID